MTAFAGRSQATQRPLERAHPHLSSASRASSSFTPLPASKDPAPLVPSSACSWRFADFPVHSTTPPTLQAKLVVNQPGDRYEQEAEQMAARIVRAPLPAAWPLAPVSQPQVSQPAVQRQCECGGTCSECQQQGEDASELLQRKAASSQPVSLPSSVHPILRTPGRPLDAASRSFMEPRFGHSFSHVRIHDDPAAVTTAATLQARAYTVGHHIVFASGELQPSTSAGRQLLAHELTHVLQQGSGPASVTPAAPMIQRQARGAAGGCGICQGGDSSATGSLVHKIVQSAFGPLGLRVKGERPVQVVPKGVPAPFTPELDLSRETPDSPWGRLIEIGEIKPLDDAGNQVANARKQLSDYASQLKFTHDEVFRLKDPPPTEIPYPNPARPPGCPPQVIHVQLTEPGIYQYYCEPPWSKLVAAPRCKCKKDEKKKKRARAVKSVAKPKDQKKTTTAATPQPKAHLYLEDVDPAFRDLTRRITARDAAPGQEFFVLVDSDFYNKTVQQQQAEQLARQTRLMQVDPRGVPMLQLTAPLVPIAIVAGAIELPLLVAGLVAVVVIAAPEEAVVGTGAAAVEGVGAATTTTEVTAGAVTTGEVTTGAATTTEVAGGAATTSEATAGAATTTEAATGAASGQGGQVISLTERLAARAAATSPAFTSQQAAAAAAVLVASGISARDAAAATQPLIGKHLTSVIRAPSSAAAYKLGDIVNVAGQKFTVVMRIGVR